MKCLCCGKLLASSEEKTGWHQRCIKHFFGTDQLPEITIDNETLKKLATESTSKGYTVPGVQKKLSLHLLSDHAHPRLTLVNYPSGFILKPQVIEYTALPEAEHLVMSMADAAGIVTVPHALISGTEGYAYITRRIDRSFRAGSVKLFAMEDFCQLDLRLTEDKYRGSYERCAKVIHRYSSRRMIDMTELYMRLVFCFIVGNSDMHLKNFSLIETKPGTAQYVLSPAYDLLPVNTILPADHDEFALTMHGKNRNLRRKDFLIFADACGLSKSAAEKMITKLISMKPTFIRMCEESLLPNNMKENLTALITQRIQRLTPNDVSPSL